MQQAFFSSSSFCWIRTMLKHHAHPLVPAMVEERTCPRPPRQKPSTLLSLYYSSSPQTPASLLIWTVYVLGNPIFL